MIFEKIISSVIDNYSNIVLKVSGYIICLKVWIIVKRRGKAGWLHFAGKNFSRKVKYGNLISNNYWIIEQD